MAVKKQKLTPWFPKSVKPVRAGVYQIFAGSVYYSLFDGCDWCGGWNTPERAVNLGAPFYGFQGTKWRGLAEQPK